METAANGEGNETIDCTIHIFPLLSIAEEHTGLRFIVVNEVNRDLAGDSHKGERWMHSDRNAPLDPSARDFAFLGFVSAEECSPALSERHWDCYLRSCVVGPHLLIGPVPHLHKRV